ncbi:MAG: alpha/beta hydrolase, partial [Halobacteriaceae archaeon]
DRSVLMIPGAGHGPFGDVFLRFARAAAEEGHDVARFELWMSPSDIDAKTDADFAADIQAGVEFLRSRGCSTITIVAKSFGGHLAIEHHPETIDRLVLWAPALLAKGVGAVPEEAREQLPSVNEGDLMTVDVPVRLLQGDDDTIPVESAEQIAEWLPRGELVVLRDEDHSFLRDHERVIEETLSFLPE